jgi:hypothetical protein
MARQNRKRNSRRKAHNNPRDMQIAPITSGEARFRFKFGYSFYVLGGFGVPKGFTTTLNPSAVSSSAWADISQNFTSWRMVGADVKFRSVSAVAPGAVQENEPFAVALVRLPLGSSIGTPTSLTQVLEYRDAKVISGTCLSGEEGRLTYRVNKSLPDAMGWSSNGSPFEQYGSLALISWLPYAAAAGSASGIIYGDLDLEFRGWSFH